MSDQIPASAEEIKQDADVQGALQQATPSDDAKPVARTRDKLLIGTHLIFLLALGILFYATNLPLLKLSDPSRDLARNIIAAIASAIGLLIALRLLDVYLISRVANPVQKYNLTRVMRLTSTPVYNYTWPLFPYIWNEIKLQIAYQSDLECRCNDAGDC